MASRSLLPPRTTLEVGAIIVSDGPIGRRAVRARLVGASGLSTRGVGHSLTLLHRRQLVARRVGPQGGYTYTALPRLRRLLDAADITLATFAPPSAPGPSPPCGGADGPESLGL